MVVTKKYFCTIGSTIQLRVNTYSKLTTWTFNQDVVISSDWYSQNGFVKRNATLNDFGRYSCKVDGTVEYEFQVILYEFMGLENESLLQLVVDADCTDHQLTFNGQSLKLKCSPQRSMYEKQNVKFEDSGIYELKKETEVKCIFEVIVYENKKCRIESTLDFPTDYSDSKKWTVDNKNVNIITNDEKTYSKQVTRSGDIGMYRCKQNDTIVYACNAILLQNTLYAIGSTLHLKCNTSSYMRAEWTLNGKYLTSASTEFHRKKADYSDSGKYECKVDGILKYENTVVVYGEYPVKMGSKQMCLDFDSPTRKWTFNNTSIDQSEWLKKEKVDFKDSGIYKYTCINSGEVMHAFKVTVYDCLFQHSFLDMRIRRSAAHVKSGNGDFKLKVKKPVSGLALIITIEEYESDDLIDLTGMKSQDNDNCLRTFKKLHFDVRECKVAQEKNIIDFLGAIVKLTKLQEYSCFVMFVGSYAGKGFMCCSDFNKEEATGLIHFSRLIGMFLEAFTDKPKLFFFDCNPLKLDLISECKNQPPIKDFSNEKLKHLYVELATNYGTTYFRNENGSLFNQFLTTSLEKHNDGKLDISEIMSMVRGKIIETRPQRENET